MKTPGIARELIDRNDGMIPIILDCLLDPWNTVLPAKTGNAIFNDEVFHLYDFRK